MDWCRGRIFINDLLAFPRVWSELQRHPDVAFIYNARNRFINPPPPGVRDWSIEFAVFVNGKVPLGGQNTRRSVALVGPNALRSVGNGKSSGKVHANL